jgi:chemotaxis protein CheC
MQDELDILREVGSIAAGHGSTALSEILGRRINLSLPVTDIISCGEVSKKVHLENIGIIVFSKILVGLQGEVAFILDEKNAFKLIDLSYRLKREEKRMGLITEVGLSLLKEVGNIVISAYLNALSLMFKRIIIPPVPTLMSGLVEDIIDIILASYGTEEYVVFIEAVFEEPQEKIEGRFYLILTPQGAKDIRETCKRMLERGGYKL